MTANETKALAGVEKSAATTWTLNTDKNQIVNGTYTTRALALYANSTDIRTYATSNSYPWFYYTVVSYNA
jgi:hypothetical protein